MPLTDVGSQPHRLYIGTGHWTDVRSPMQDPGSTPTIAVQDQRVAFGLEMDECCFAHEIRFLPSLLLGGLSLWDYFTEPAVNPLMKKRCRLKNTSSGTLIEMKEPAATVCQPSWYCPSMESKV